MRKEKPEKVGSITENENCTYCGREFDSLEKGKLRMGESFCSIWCADKEHPKFSKTKYGLHLKGLEHLDER